MDHDPALPFKLDIEAASVWLDGLSVANIRESCRVLYPVLRALNASAIEPRLRFAILEKCRATVTGLDKGLLSYFLDKPFPLDGKTRKIASLCSRFHGELAAGYRQLVEAETSTGVFNPSGQALIIGRAFEYYANSLLRSAQIYEAQPSAFWSFVFGLFRLAEERGLCHSSPDDKALGTVSVPLFFKVILLFGMAAPSRLSQQDMQRLFDFLVAHADLVRIESTPVSNGARAVLCFDLSVGGSIMPVPAPAPVDKPGLRFLFMERLLNEFRNEIRTDGKPEENPLALVLPRLGDRLPNQSELTARRAVASLGVEAIAATVGRIESRRISGASQSLWSNLDQLELAPLSSDMRPEILGSKSTGTFAAALVSGSAARDESLGIGFRDILSVKVYRSELPGFYIIDSGGQVFRVGDPLALNTDDEIIQVGVVRGGQIYSGQFCYNVELFGNRPCFVRFFADSPGSRAHKGLLFKMGADVPGSLVIPPVKLRCGDTVLVEEQGEKNTFRVARLIEANSNFCQIALTTAEAPASSV